jgi:rhamnosyltransferase
MRPTVSIVVPTRNAGPGFHQILDRLRTQKGFYEPEIIVIDSESSDGTPEIARQYGANVIEISAGSFNHGLTRNLGIQRARGEICVLLVQDALPIHDDWLQALVNPFERDPSICGVTTTQLPRPECDIVCRWEIQHHNSYLGQNSAIRSIPNWDSFSRLSIQERFFACNFDNVCSAIRRSAWEHCPFRPLAFAEDLDWAVRILRAGKKIAYEPAAVVLHSHLRPAIYHLRRQYISAKVVPEILEAPIPATFSSSDQELFAAVNDLIQEGFYFLLLVDQFEGIMHPWLWRQWVGYVERKGIRQNAIGHRPPESTPIHISRGWVSLFLRSKPSLMSRIMSPKLVRANPMRDHFFFLLSAVPQNTCALDAPVLRHLLVHCLARTLGHFLGSHFLQSERQGGASAELRALDRSLCVGV